MQRHEPFIPAFNGRLEHANVGVDAGDLVRVYFVDVGPGTAAAHVVGTVLGRVYEIFEFYVPAPGATSSSTTTSSRIYPWGWPSRLPQAVWRPPLTDDGGRADVEYA